MLGVKVTVSVQLEPAATEAPQLCVREKSDAPELMVTLLRDNGVLPVLFNVTL